METQTMDVLLIASEADSEEALRCLLEARPEDPTEAVRYQLARVKTISEATAHLEAEPVDVLLLDLAGHDAAEVIVRMEQHLLALGVPILLLADEKDAAAAHYAITRGAQDYLVKGALNRPWLHSALRMAIDRHRVRAQLRTYTDLLAASEIRFRTIIEQNADGILIVDPSGEILFTNQAAQKLLKRSKQALEGAHWGASLVAGPAAELDITRPDGSQIVVEMRATDIVWEGERASLATLRDVTERNAAQEALEETAIALQHSNKELRMFADAASHDLRQPLRSTSMYLELLMRRYGEDLNEEATAWLGSVENGIQRMWNLIDALLQYTRLDVENMKLKPVDANTVFEQTVAHLKADIDETDAEVTSDDLPTVRADASQLAQVFQNLVGNALKFRGDEAPRVHISAEREYQDWIFACTDNGIGIEETYQDRIFNMFERLHPRDAYPGTGIGLAVCKKIITRHDGRIWVASKPGEGATFFFSLPAA